MYTFSFIVGGIIQKSVKCIHSAIKFSRLLGKVEGSSLLRGQLTLSPKPSTLFGGVLRFGFKYELRP